MKPFERSGDDRESPELATSIPELARLVQASQPVPVWLEQLVLTRASVELERQRRRHQRAESLRARWRAMADSRREEEAESPPSAIQPSVRRLRPV